MSGSRVRKLAFTMYPIRDPDRARAFYGETLGLKVGTNHDQWIERDLPGGTS
jgi:extradiol dioxygenase family protein